MALFLRFHIKNIYFVIVQTMVCRIVFNGEIDKIDIEINLTKTKHSHIDEKK